MTTSTRIVIKERVADLQTVAAAITVAFLATAGVTGLQSTVPWTGTRPEFLILASVMAALALVAAVFFRARGRMVHGSADSWVGLIFLLIGLHFALRLALAPFGLPPDHLAPIVLTSWVTTQLASALILLFFMSGRMGESPRETILISGGGLVVAAGIFLLGIVLMRLDAIGSIKPLNLAVASIFLVATAVTLIQAFRERQSRIIWLGSAFICVTAAHTDLVWSHSAYDSAFMWGHVLLLIGLTIPLCAAVAENLSLLSSQARLNRRIRRLGQRVEALLDSLPVLVLTLDGGANLKYANRRAHRLLGVPPGVSSNLAGPVWTRGMEPDDAGHLLDEVGLLARGGLDGTTNELRLTAADGTVHWLSVELRPVHDPVEDEPRVLLTGSEITDLLAAQRTAERRHERLSLLTNLAQGIGVETTEEGVLHRFFELASEHLGLQAAAILRPEPDRTRLTLSGLAGSLPGMEKVFHEDPIPAVALRSFHDAFPHVTEPGMEESSSGTPRRLALTPLLAGGQAVGVLAMVGGRWPSASTEDLDVLLQVGTLVGGALHLGDVLQELEAQRSIALEGSRLKSEFLANTSHELRTPLSSILGFLKLILDGHVPDPKQQRRYLTIAHESATRLLAIINDVLDLAKIEAGRLETRPEMTPVTPILADLESLFRHQARDKGVELSVTAADHNMEIFADPDRTRQILTNLLSNALKFTPSNGSIVLEVLPAKDHVSFSVCDTGAGIPADELERVFDSFHQVDGSTTRAAGGTGLGLTISRLLAKKMQGSLILESAGAGRGTTVRLLLPRHPPDRY